MTNHPGTLSDSRYGRGAGRRLLAGVAALCLLVFAQCAWAVNVHVGDEIYDLLLRLEAEGVLQSSILTTKPITRKEAMRLVREAVEKSKDRSPHVRQIVRILEERFPEIHEDVKFIKPFDTVYSRYAYSDSDNKSLDYNNDGDNIQKGSNLRAGFTSSAEIGRFSAFLNPEFRYSDNDSDLILKRAYGSFALGGLELTVGKDSQWWGPGHHGSLLLSNNAEPMTMLRLTNPQPVLLPWIFRPLGLFRFSVFATRLEKQRKDVPEPYLWGMRLNFKPNPYIEVGLQRTALLGGEGRSESLGTWWNSFTGRREGVPGVEAGDQRAGFDIKVTLPFKHQPVQLYLEAAGEDEAGGLPYKWAYLTGLYFPRILNFDRIGLRIEYANNHVRESPNVWYRHHVYTDGYTYKGKIIGHHMGTDSKDLFAEISYFVPNGNTKVTISYNKQEHNLSQTIREKKDKGTLNLNRKLAKNLELDASYSYAKIKNIGGISSKNEKISRVAGAIIFSF